jgi:hypothetical protein
MGCPPRGREVGSAEFWAKSSRAWQDLAKMWLSLAARCRSLGGLESAAEYMRRAERSIAIAEADIERGIDATARDAQKQ